MGTISSYDYSLIFKLKDQSFKYLIRPWPVVLCAAGYTPQQWMCQSPYSRRPWSPPCSWRPTSRRRNAPQPWPRTANRSWSFAGRIDPSALETSAPYSPRPEKKELEVTYLVLALMYVNEWKADYGSNPARPGPPLVRWRTSWSSPRELTSRRCNSDEASPPGKTGWEGHWSTAGIWEPLNKMKREDGVRSYVRILSACIAKKTKQINLLLHAAASGLSPFRS